MISVGRNEVTPVRASRRRAAAHCSGVASAKSTPKQPLTCRSTMPGVSTPLGRLDMVCCRSRDVVENLADDALPNTTAPGPDEVPSR